jgi:hypothetical protein
MRKNTCHSEGAPAPKSRETVERVARPKNLVDGRSALSVTTLPREKPRSTGCTVAEPDSSVGAPAPAWGEGSRGRLPQNDSDPSVRCFSGSGIRRFRRRSGRSRVGRGGHPIHRTGTVSGAGEAEGRHRGGEVAGGHPRFSREAPMPPERPGASRHRSPLRDLVDSRTARKVAATSRSGGRTGAPSGSTARQAPRKDARQVEASAGCRAYTAGKVSAEDFAILTVAGACDGTTAGLVTGRTCGGACNPICDEPRLI